MTVIDKIKIPLADYEGYLWYSDQERPDYIGANQKLEYATLEESLTRHPFVVEGALYNKVTKTSISIRCLDGKYFIHQFNANKLDKDEYKDIEHTWFVAKDEQKKAKMKEVWELQKDEYCAGMMTYKPVFWLFMGFE